VGERGMGFYYAMMALDFERINDRLRWG